ncbi:two component, sigma54 specific, transcriptional regulator, Fis family [Desulfobacca acetoxidans DSM 11109]|uniref:Two component, sigma54 specific, transcriptional regulator, Fis family n=1 Tax=Desulfobacca acetoxidans (strain ATCC 700848 / DSM 11109 / ASRB2) TaxID=880072 RepID=F2NGT4_DESAR|nr:two component, sigma54 specific, transcriptional regulator, Fis family [Desulfobacca acetoxidans DSM 11109]
MVDDEPVVRSGIAQVLSGQNLEVRTAADGSQALEMMAAAPPEVVLLDIKMPDLDGIGVLKIIRQEYPASQVIMITGHPDVEGAVECMKLGAVDYLVKPFRIDELESLVRKALDLFKRGPASAPSPLEEPAEQGIASIIGSSPVMQKVFAKIRRAAPSDSTVLLTGESGTGKELVARAIHDLSPRAHREFVPVDCSALVETLLESELFGHVKGSFTGAHQTKHGLFELANHGTFFFDEITNLSLNIQAKLLRVIQEREFMRVGSQKRTKLDIRIIASCNRDLTESIKDGSFREDLYYRLSVIPIHLPPLRERTGDIPLLAEYFLKKYSQKTNRQAKGISNRALKMLCAYSWPGNVRELEHTIERMIILEDGDTILPEHLPSFISQRRGEFQVFSDEEHSLEELEKRYIQFILRRTKGKRQEAARILGINRKTLGQRIKKYNLRVNW